jgi:hypothetical protein
MLASGAREKLSTRNFEAERGSAHHGGRGLEQRH